MSRVQPLAEEESSIDENEVQEYLNIDMKRGPNIIVTAPAGKI